MAKQIIPVDKLHDQLHDIDSTEDHVGIVAVEDNFISFDANGLPQDSGFNGLSFGEACKNNLIAVSNPTVNDDDTQGYSSGSLWFNINSSPKEIFRCVDDTTGAAVWLNTSLEIGELGTIATQNSNNVTITGGSISSLTDPVDEHGVGDRGYSDTRYYPQTSHINSSAGVPDAGKPIVLNADGNVDPSMGSGLENIVEDLTPQLGGNLDMNGHNIGGNTEAELDDAVAKKHTQNTDTGTDSTTFQIGTGGPKVKNSTGEVQSRNAADNDYADIRAKDIYGNVIKYNTIYIDAGAMVPCTTNGALQGTKEYPTNDIDIDYFAFDAGATEERVQFKLKMPESWDRSTIKVKFDWSSAIGSSIGDTVEWGIKARAISDNDAMDSALGTPQVISDAILAVNGDVLQITSATPAITVGGTPALGDLIVAEIYRNTDGIDDMTEDAWLFGITIQYQETNLVTAW